MLDNRRSKTAIIVILLAVSWNGVKDLAGILNFALGLTSLVLAIIAIIYGFIANNAFAVTVSKIDYAFGYLVASASASFFKFNTKDNVNIMVTHMPTSVAERIEPAIKGRLEYVGVPNEKDFKSQLENIDAFIASVAGTNKKPLGGAKE